jgi:hypothetical protein
MVIVFFASSGIAQAGAGEQTGSGGGGLPNAPEPQLAGSRFFGLSVHPSVKNASPERTPVLLESLEGTSTRLSLVTPVSSASPTGSTFQAQLEEPLAEGRRVLLPKGTLFEGHLESRRARRLMRPGSLFMTFDRLILPNGDVQNVNLHLVSTNRAATKVDSEGCLHPALSKKRVALQVGGTALTAKLADDIAESAGGTAVGAGNARLIGTGAAATFFVLQKGKEVKLKPGDKLEVEFDRSATDLRDLRVR